MRPPLQVQDLSILKPLLITIAKIICKNGNINKSEIHLIAFGEGISSENILWELELFSKIFIESRKNKTLEFARIALTKRGLSIEEANILLKLVVGNHLKSEDQSNYLNQPILKLRGKFKIGPSYVDEAKKIIGKGNIIQEIPYDKSSIVILSTYGAELFDIEQNRTLWEIYCPCVNGKISSEGDQIIFQKGEAFFIWDLNTGKLINNIEISGEYEDFFFDAKQQKIILIKYESIEKWDLDNRIKEVCINIEDDFDTEQVRVNSDFSMVAIVPQDNVGFYDENLDGQEFKERYDFLDDVTFKCWDLFSGDLVWEIKDVIFAEFDSQFKRLATCYRNRLDIWDSYSHKKIWKLEKDNNIDIVRFHPHKNQIAIGSNGIIELFDISLFIKIGQVDIFGNFEFEEDVHFQKITSKINISPNGRYIVVRADAKEISNDEFALDFEENDFDSYEDSDHGIQLILNSDLTKKMDLDISLWDPEFSIDGNLLDLGLEIYDLENNGILGNNHRGKYDLGVENIKFHPIKNKIVTYLNKHLNIIGENSRISLEFISTCYPISRFTSKFTSDGKYCISEYEEQSWIGEDHIKEDDRFVTSIRNSFDFSLLTENSNISWDYDPNNDYFAISKRYPDEVFDFYSFKSPFGINIFDLKSNWENDHEKNPDNEVIQVFKQDKHRIKRIMYFERIKNFKFNNDGSKIVVLSEDNILRIWDLITSEDKGFKFDSNLQLITVNKKNEILIEVGDSWKSTYIVVLNIFNWGVIDKIDESWNKICSSKDITTLIKYQQRFNLEFDEIFNKYDQFRYIKNFLFWLEREKINFYDLTKKKLMKSINQGNVESFDISKDEKEIVVGYSNGVVLLYDLSEFLKDYEVCESN